MNSQKTCFLLLTVAEILHDLTVTPLSAAASRKPFHLWQTRGGARDDEEDEEMSTECRRLRSRQIIHLMNSPNLWAHLQWQKDLGHTRIADRDVCVHSHTYARKNEVIRLCQPFSSSRCSFFFFYLNLLPLINL